LSRHGWLNGLRVMQLSATAGRLMSFPAVVVPAELGLADAVERYFVHYRYRAFPVREGRRIVGLIDLGSIERVAEGRRRSTTVGEAAIRDREVGLLSITDVRQVLRAVELSAAAA